MRKILIITAGLLVGLGIVTAIGYGLLFHSGAGRVFVINQIERELGEALNSEASVRAFGGAPPGRIVLHDLSLSENNTPWLTIERVELKWRPFSLIGGKLNVELLSLRGGRLLSVPPEERASADDAEPLSIRLPRDLPDISVEKIDISDFIVKLNGSAHRLNGGGAVKMGGEFIDANLALKGDDGLDDIDIVLNLAPENDRVLINAKIDAKPGGAIASLANLDAPLFITATSDSPLAATDIAIAAAISDYGDVTAAIKTNLQKLSGADATITFTPGSALTQTPELSKPLTADVRAEERQNGGAFLVRNITGAPGKLSGEILWRNRGRFVENLTANLSGTLDETYRPELSENLFPAYLNGSIVLTTELQRRNDGYGVTALLKSGSTQLALTDGRTNLDNALSGDIALQLPALQDAPAPMSLSANALGRIDINVKEAITLRAFTLNIGDTSSIGGEASYSFADETLNAAGDITAAPTLIAALTPSVSTKSAIEGEFSLSGKLDRLALDTDFEAPAFTINDNVTPPFTVKAALVGLPSLPTGDIIAEAKGDAQGRFEAQIRASIDGLITVPKLDYSGAGFSLTGTGSINPSAQNLALNLVYQGENQARPLPGLVLSGNLRAEGALSRDNTLNSLIVSSPSLIVNDVSMSGLSLTAEGPPNATQVTLDLVDLKTPDADLIQNLSADAIIALQSSIDVTLNKFDAIVVQNETRLTAPAAFNFNNGVTIQNLRVAYGEEGAIALDGIISPSQWQAALTLNEVNIPEADGRITLNLDIDTDRKIPAAGSFLLRSLLLEGQDASISGDILWNGKSLILTNEREADELDMRIALPALLNRTPKLELNTDGPLDGYARYNGALGTIAAYLPPALQTLEGEMVFDMTLAGDTKAPQLKGRAQILDGRYTELQSGFSLVGLHLQADAAYEDAGSIVSFSGGARGAGQTGEDTITLAGNLDLSEGGSLDLEATMNNAVMSARPVDMVRANGNIVISGPLDAVKAQGEIRIEELDAEIITPENTGLVAIDVVAYNGAQPASSLRDQTASDPALDYQIRVVADDRIFVRGRGLESEWSADINAINEGDNPVVLGAMNLRRGWLDFSGRRFNLTRGVITFDRLSTNNPLLDIRAEYETGDGVTAIIAVTGRGDAPSISLESIPEQPSEDVMALVLFGKPAQELGPVETLQIAEALASLSGIGPFGGQGVTGRLRQALGLDLLNIDPDLENGGGELTVGKYVTDGVFVSATQDAQGRNGSVRVEYEVTDNITVETELAQDGEQTVSANWKRDF